MDAREMRRKFFSGLLTELGVLWPILSSLIGVMLLMGFVIAYVEGWDLGDAAYFAFVSGLTIGYGDLVPRSPISRVLAVCIGFSGILLTGLVAAIAVRALGDLEGQNRAE